MKLEGSCHCGAVTFTVNSRTPYPFNHCYCSKCRKTGGGGYAVNIMAAYDTLEVTGADNISVYRSRNNHRGLYEEDGLGFSRRSFWRRAYSSPAWSPCEPRSGTRIIRRTNARVWLPACRHCDF